MTDNHNSKEDDLHAQRTEYRRAELHRSELESDPFKLFSNWLELAREVVTKDATSMTLATATTSGIPSARTVLLKQFDSSGFCWYTSYESRKGNELLQNPNAALLFFWPTLERQIRIEGSVAQVSAEQSDEYFKSRPPGSQYSAAASPQSAVITNQAWLTDKINALKNSFSEEKLQRPASWGGYRLTPAAFEFWQGRPSRSHDRFRYSRENNGWQIDRLAP